MSDKPLTKGYIKNMRNYKYMKFLYNPESMQVNRNNNWSEILSPGANYPTFQYINGSATQINFKLLLAGGDKKKVNAWLNFLGEFMPMEVFRPNYAPPPTFLLAYGTYVRHCLLETLDYDFKMWDNQLYATMVEISLGVKVVSRQYGNIRGF